jgi:hypothetical protein
MIKSWDKFNESIFFEDSPQYKSIFSKYEIKKEDIIEILQDLEDDRNIECTRIYNKILERENKIFFLLQLSKKYSIKDYSSDFTKYKSFLDEQSSDIERIIKFCSQIESSEDIKLNTYKILKYPESDIDRTLGVQISFVKEVETDEMEKALKEFNKEESLEKKLYDEVLRKVISMGVPEKDARILVDPHPDWENMDYIFFGFLTNDEIRAIAEYDKTKKKLRFDEEELYIAVGLYEEGECNEYL